MDSPTELKILTTKLIEHDFLSKDKKNRRLSQLFLDLNRSESHISFGSKSINLQSLLNPNTMLLLEKNKNFQQLFILEITKQLGIYDSSLVEQALLFLSQDLSVPAQSMLITTLCANPKLTLEEINAVGSDIVKYINNQPPALFCGKPVYSAQINSDGTVKISSKIPLEKIISKDGKEYISKKTEDNISLLEFTVNPHQGTIEVLKLTIPSIVAEYKADQNLLQDTNGDSRNSSLSNRSANIKPANPIYRLIKFLYGLVHNIINFIGGLFTQKHDGQVIPQPGVPAAILSPRTSMSSETSNIAPNQAQPPAPSRCRRAH